MNASISLKPFESETKSSIWAIDNALPWERRGTDASGAPSEKNATGTWRMWEICCNRLAPMRLVPFSYFCTCWKVSPRASPSFPWLIASILRRMRTRPPTYLSTGLGDFFSTLANIKKRHFCRWPRVGPKQTVSVNAPVAIGHGDRGLASRVLRFPRSSSDCTFGCILLRIKFCMHPVNDILHVSHRAVCDCIRLLKTHPAVRLARLVSFRQTNRTEHLGDVGLFGVTA